MTTKERRIAEALNTSLVLNVSDKQARKNIAVAVGHALKNSRVGFDLDVFVNTCIKEW